MLFHVESSPRGIRRPHAGQCETEQCMVKRAQSPSLVTHFTLGKLLALTTSVCSSVKWKR